MYDILILLLAYLFGSIPFGLVITRLFGVPDIRSVGSGNIGATNVLRTAGIFPALLVTLLDIAKGTLAVIIAGSFGGYLLGDIEYLKLVAGLLAILGHVFPIFIGFRGGKGINTALGVFITLLIIPTLIALAIFIISVVITRYVSLGSILASLTLPISIFVLKTLNPGQYHPVYLPVTVIFAVLAIFAHRTNIKRLVNGVENKFSFRSKPASEAEDYG
ncbi:MAG: acyl-phosphate glycerol 3-phosphate acyltransferase [Candidatus Zixiibacteriota bacterium]|nr:MAG: acyl-phosphate glycerol 3-phosphate acyltransferase [candidate division Zixibacteria bacterium]